MMQYSTQNYTVKMLAFQIGFEFVDISNLEVRDLTHTIRQSPGSGRRDGPGCRIDAHYLAYAQGREFHCIGAVTATNIQHRFILEVIGFEDAAGKTLIRGAG